MKFKCKTTNLIYNFEFEVDIQSMLKHPDYESVPDNEPMDEAPAEEAPVAKPAKKSAKVATPTSEEPVEGN